MIRSQSRELCSQFGEVCLMVLECLIAKGMPFREAHHVVGEVVVEAIAQKKPIEEFELASLQAFAAVIEEDVYQCLTIDSCLAKREALGGTSLTQVKAALAAKA